MRQFTMIMLGNLVAGLMLAASLPAAPEPAAGAADLVAILTAQENQTLDLVELGTGKRFVRPVLEGIVVRDGAVVSLRLQGDGRVIMSCHRGGDAPAFGHMLVHETSHGFTFRWLSPARLPNWLNEGIAEWVGTKVVPNSNQVPLKEARALEYLRSRGDLGPEFLTRDNIDAVQYGIASGMVTFLAREPAKFAAYVRSIKEGMPMEESLRQAYGVSVEEFVAAYGHAIGVPQLRP